MLRILTYNIRYGEKLDQIISWLSTLETPFDIICFQEFPIDEIKPFLSSIKAKDLDYRFSHGFKKKNKAYGQLTLFNTKKVTLLEDTVLPLGPSFLERSRVRGERSSLITRFQYQKKEFVLANTHLVCFALNKRRLLQLERIIAHFSENITKNIPILVVGDLNYSSLIRQQRLLNFMEGHGFTNAYTTNTYRLLFLKYQLDYVFYKLCQVSDVDVLRLNFSDHFPAAFTITI